MIATRSSEPFQSYTRADAIDDGVLIEVPQQLAKDAGFELPLGYTEDVHLLLLIPTASECHPSLSGHTYESRLRDLLKTAAATLSPERPSDLRQGSDRSSPRGCFEARLANPASGTWLVHKLLIEETWELPEGGPFLTIVLATN